MNDASMRADRRRFLQRTAHLAGALGTGTLGALLPMAAARAAGDYKALVCIFLYGGNDGLAMVTPADTPRYNQYAAVRGALAVPRANLLGLNANYGLHPSMSALLPAWNAARLAPVFNVGPLYAPLTKSQYLAAAPDSPLVPDSLFSHSDQQLLWESGSTDAVARTGWGGRASNLLATVNPVISVGGNGRFGVEDLRMPLVLPGTPGAFFGAYGTRPEDTTWTPQALRKTALDALYAANQGNPLGVAYAKQQRDAFAISQRLAGIVASVPGDGQSSAAIDNAFRPLISGTALTTGLAAQLYQIAKLVRDNAAVQGTRQIFFAQLGGFDTHAQQIDGSPTTGTHAALLKQLADALAAFDAAMVGLGLAAQVTSFTQSDFGRTLAPNQSRGTDHAWGNHQLVLGGAVKGKLTYGAYPQLVLGGPDDVGVESWELQGRWIPTAAVDQFAATLLGWFGASDPQLDAILPNLKNFGSKRRLGFL